MMRMFVCCLLLFAPESFAVTPAHDHENSLLQTWDQALDGSSGSAAAKEHDTPVTRVTNLLKEIQGTLRSEMDEDKELFSKLTCWCNNNAYSKTESIGAGNAKIAGLEATIEALTAKGQELTTKIRETEQELAQDKEDLAEATALREKESTKFHSTEMDAIQAIENLKAAMAILGKHQAGDTNWHAALPQTETSFVQVIQNKDFPWAKGHENKNARELDGFLTDNGFNMDNSVHASPVSKGFLQAVSPSTDAAWTADELAILKLAERSASVFMQAHHEQGSLSLSGPGGGATYQSRSGEILGIMKTVMEEMQASLSSDQKEEAQKAAQFAELRNAKEAEIANGEKMAETKEDELAQTHNDLAEAKEDLLQAGGILAEDQAFLKNTKKTCSEADAAFQERTKARLAEIEAVSETIQILQGDDARDAMTGTFSFMQISSSKGKVEKRRKNAVLMLRKSGAKLRSPHLSMLANQVELDSFGKVKKAIENMIATQEQQQADEVKKNDWCEVEVHENEMKFANLEEQKKDLESKIAVLGSKLEQLAEEIEALKKAIADLELSLQRAGENRKMDNMEYQKTVADQAATINVMELALNRLAKFYDKEFLLQTHTGKQTPPVPQMEYTPNSGSTGVMAMIEKLIYEAKELMADSKKQENDATVGYETLVVDTFASLKDLQQEVTSKTAAKANAAKDKLANEDDLTEVVLAMEGNSKATAEVHAECDYVMKNFAARQEARAQEIEALKQSIQVLEGATMS